MRLTLRNLLRFLDRSDLDPLEKAQLEELVNKSDRASAWIHRIKTLRTDPKKSVPKDNGTSAIGDVVRYLDGIMTEQEAIEFEKTMLVSDHLLAEVASVHWMIHQKQPSANNPVSLVLRQTLYDIDRVFATSTDKVASGGDQSVGSAIPASMSDLPFVDAVDVADDAPSDARESALDANGEQRDNQPPVSLEQMKQRSKNRSWMAVAIVIGTLVGTTSLSFWLGQRSANRLPVAVYDEPADADSKPENGPKPVVNESGSVPEKKAAEQPETVNEPPVVANTPPPAIANYPRPPEKKLDTAEKDDESGNSLPRRANISWTLYTPVPPEEFIGPIEPPRVVATSGLRQPTALFRTGESDWAVVDEQTNLVEGDEVLVLSGSQATFQLADSLTLIADGPASFSIGKHDRASGTDLIILNSGRMQVTTELVDVDCLLQIRSDLYRITMFDEQSVVEAHVCHFFPPGTDPRENTPAQTRVIRSVAGRSRLIQDESAWTLDKGMALIQSQSETPEWMVPAQLGVFEPDETLLRYVNRVRGVVDRDAREWVKSQTDTPAELINLKNHSRQEVRMAAMIWLAELGQFEFVVDYFGNEQNESNWRTFLEALRSIIQSNPEYGEPLFKGLALAGDAEQQRWFKLILGYSQAELENGADAKLVEWLRDESLGIRALAIENLREITGGTTFGYFPTRTNSIRDRNIDRQWVPFLEKKGIRYATPPAPALPRVTVVPTSPDPAGEDSETAEETGSL